MPNENERNDRKVLRGVVVSDKMSKTRVVSVERIYRHSLYEKTLREKKKYYAHDEAEQSKLGDTVEIMSARPMSKLKRWRVYRVLEKKNK